MQRSEYEDLHQIMSPDEQYQYVPPGDFGYGFEATLQEGKMKRNKSRSFRKKLEMKEMPPPQGAEAYVYPLTQRNRSWEEPPTYMDRSLASAYPLGGNRSFEDLPSGVVLDSWMRGRNGSFAEIIPPGKKNDPLDSESIRDVSKALREMERKLQAAGAEGKKVSRTKVMKALLTVVDQLDENGSTVDGSFQSPSTNTGADLCRTWASDADAIALDRQRRNMEQIRELTITPSKDYSARPESPWKEVKPSFSKMDDQVKPSFITVNDQFKLPTTAETEAEPEYISSSSDEEDEAPFSGGSRRKLKKQPSEKGSFPRALDQDSRYSQDTQEFKEIKGHEHNKGKSKKGSFAHAVSPSTAAPTTGFGFDLFSVDMKDPAVQDALSDLFWIQSPTKSVIEASSKAPFVTLEHPSTPSSQGVHLRQDNVSISSYKGEDEFHDKPDMGEETTTETTQSSSAGTLSTTKPMKERKTSWWRRNRAALEPSSKDTPIGQEQPRQIQTRVTVRENAHHDSDPWRTNHQWENH
jgi:hypothetical protein